MNVIEAVRQDVVTGARMLRRNPGFAIAALLTLAVGIGANTAIFTLVNAVLIEPLPYPHADRIVQLWTATPQGAGLIVSIPQFNLLAQNPALQDVAAYDFRGPGVNLTGEGEPEQVSALHVSANYFNLFGARTEAGRTFSPDEDRPYGGHVVVLGYGLWAQRFHGDRSIVGKAISLGNEPYLVTGVLGENFRPDPPAQIWLPLQADLASTSHAAYVRSAARLREGISIGQANALLQSTTAEMHRRFPRMNPSLSFQAKPLRETNAGAVRTALLVLFGTVIFVLLIACSNVSSLLLARAVARRREIAIRAAVGASRRRLIAQMLTESLLLSIVGGLLGLIVARISLRALPAFDAEAIPGSGALALNWRVWTFAAAVSVGATLLFGLLPALRASRLDLARAMQEAGARAGVGRGTAKARSALVIVQVALAVVLAVGAGLMLRTFAALREVKPGIEPHRVLTMEMSLQGTRFHDTASVARLVHDGVERLKQIPGVTAAATSWTLPVENAFSSSFIIEGRPLGDDLVHGGALMRPVSPEFLEVFGISLRRGRFFRESDTASVAVISEAMAEKFWPRGDAIGERITIDKYIGPEFAAPPREILGVVSDVHDIALNQAPLPIIYIPQWEVANGMTGIDVGVLPITWAIRTAVEPYSLSAPMRRVLREASGGLAVAHIRSMDEVVRRSTSRSDFTAVLLASFAGASLLLAAVGIYGLIAFSVRHRQQEIGIRMALGASPDQVRKMVVWEGMRLTISGVVLGAAASIGLARYMKTLVFGVQPVDPIAIAAGAVVLCIIAGAAAYIPAYRASRVDAAEVLRSA